MTAILKIVENNVKVVIMRNGFNKYGKTRGQKSAQIDVDFL